MNSDPRFLELVRLLSYPGREPNVEVKPGNSRNANTRRPFIGTLRNMFLCDSRSKRFPFVKITGAIASTDAYYNRFSYANRNNDTKG